MRRRTLDVQREPEDEHAGNSMLWWGWLIPLALVGILIAIMVPVISAGGIQPIETPVPMTEPPAQADLTLDEVLDNTDMPREFSYGGMQWVAMDAGRYELDGRDLIAIGPRIAGNELYYEQGTPTSPYETLYLRGDTEGYRDVYVMYEPAATTPGEGPPDESGRGAPAMGTPGQATPTLDEVLDNTDMPREFSYGGMQWMAMEVGRYQQQGTEMVAVNQMIDGYRLYRVRGAPTEPYQALYLQAHEEQYSNMFVKYTPTN